MPMDSKIAQATTGRPLTALELALTIVTGGLAVAAVMIALAAPAQASQQTLMQQEPGTVALDSLGPEEGELLDELPLAALDRDAADWASDTGLPNFPGRGPARRRAGRAAGGEPRRGPWSLPGRQTFRPDVVHEAGRSGEPALQRHAPPRGRTLPR